MKITMIVEGRTEHVFLPCLKRFVDRQLDSLPKPRIGVHVFDGRIPTGSKLQRVVQNLLREADHVVALTDVYTGRKPPEFPDAVSAKTQMRQWVGAEPRFHPHVAQHDFEAWLLPYWPQILDLAKAPQRKPPFQDPEKVNHGKPPAHLLREVFESGKCRKSYSKPRDAGRILRDNDLLLAVSQCSELRALVNTILLISGGSRV